MEAVIERENLKKALAQVKRNKGSAGADGMTVGELPAYLKEHWPTIRAQLLEGTYKPRPVRRVEIPKALGGMRLLGIPTVLDRFVQQVVMQVLQADWDGTFSETSFGFRPGRSAHQAVERAQAYISSGHATVVDIDLEKFLDVASYYTFSFFERVEEVRSNCRYLNSYAFCPSAIDVNGLKLAALYTLQDGLPRDAE
ncbi:reverse transcriptase domain-containing protein [Bradyrhizobium arachidis]|uniref:reverse transcriptase domain-containing protein n=1 Tax=Bradyrhizobium arachidis TaxID=858423 RepID=UPI002867E8B1|nr:reverse transcriptase domain-containing protein [Bradyrhizobium arachidis]